MDTFNSSKIPKLMIDDNGNGEMTIYIEKSFVWVIKQIINAISQGIEKRKIFTISIDWKKKSKTKDANSYMWVLCQKLAEKLQSTKEEIYQKFIREVGQFEILPIKNECLMFWIDSWCSRGLGWYAEIENESSLKGYTRVINYYGSSVYNSEKMSVLINEIVNECKEQGIETMAPKELESLIERWGKK